MLVFFGNTLNLHQLNLADALYELTQGDFKFVETVKPRKENTWGGKLKIERPYVLAAYINNNAFNEALRYSREADVALFGANSFNFEIERMSLANPGLSFEGSERWLKHGWINLLSPRLLKYIWFYHINKWKNKPIYKLCASAYGAKDQYILQTFKNRCFKWGYFTKVDDINIDMLLRTSISNKVNILWCARFLKLKHPELVVKLARRLKGSGYDVHIDMYGEGEELEGTKRMCRKMDVEDMISFKGNVPNTVIIEAMRQHDIFLFTSDRHEGWGAVMNEAMSNGCTVVASNAIGSVPFLVQDGINGFIFQSGSVSSLYNKVLYLLDNPLKRKEMAVQAYRTMKNVWSPQIAAKNLLQLIDDLQDGQDTSILEGPCSNALPI